MRERAPVWSEHVGHLTNPSRESLARPLSFLFLILLIPELFHHAY